MRSGIAWLGVALIAAAGSARAEIAWPEAVERLDPFVMAVSLAVFLILVWAIFATRRLARREALARRRVAELEGHLNDAEAALTAEPHVLVVWRERDGAPERIAGSMRGAAQVPETLDLLMDFESWLDPEFRRSDCAQHRRNAQERPAVQYRGENACQ